MFANRLVRDAELAFLNAPFREDGWLHATRLMAEATGTAVGQLCGAGMGPGLTFNLLSEERHDPHDHLVNPLLYGPENWRINCTTGGARSIQHERDYAAYRSSNPTTFYDDAVSDLDLPFGCQSPLMLDSGGLVGLALLRSTRDGPCTPEIIADFARIARQAHRAVRVQLALGQERGEAMLSGLARSGEMTLLLDRQGRLVAMTEAAEALFDCPFGLQLDGLNVRLEQKVEDKALQAAMGRLLASDGIDGPVVHQAIAGRNEQRPQGFWRLFLTRIPARYDLLAMEAQLALTLRPLLPA
jgi:PAS domain-containing protein